MCTVFELDVRQYFLFGNTQDKIFCKIAGSLVRLHNTHRSTILRLQISLKKSPKPFKRTYV